MQIQTDLGYTLSASGTSGEAGQVVLAKQLSQILRPDAPIRCEKYGLGVDLGFGGIANDAAEGERLAAAFGNKNVLIMGNHGVTVCGRTVAEAFEDLYFVERAAKLLVLAYSTGQPLNVMPDDLAQKTADGWLPYNDQAFAHFDYLKRHLDKTDSSYRD